MSAKPAQSRVVKWSPFDEDNLAVAGKTVRLLKFKPIHRNDESVSVITDITVAETATSKVLASNRFPEGISRKPCIDWMPSRSVNLIAVPLVNGDISLSVLHPNLSALHVRADLKESAHSSAARLAHVGDNEHDLSVHTQTRGQGQPLRRTRSIGNLNTYGERVKGDLHANDGVTERKHQAAVLHLRNSRACVALQFNSHYSHLVACGYERHRGEAGLLVWDINKVDIVASGATSGTSASVRPVASATSGLGRFSSHYKTRGEAGLGGIDGKTSHLSVNDGMIRSRSSENLKGGSEITPYRPMSHSEALNSIAWVPHTPHVLMGGIAGRYLRAYDVRAGPDTPKQSVGTRAVGNLTFNPYRSHVFASTSETESVVRVWDIRAMVDPVMSIQTASPVVCMEWCPTRSGYLACLNRTNRHKIDIYDINQARIDDGGTRYAVANVRSKRMAWDLSSFQWHPHQAGRIVAVTPDGFAESTIVYEPSAVGFPASRGGLGWINGQSFMSSGPFNDLQEQHDHPAIPPHKHFPTSFQQTTSSLTPGISSKGNLSSIPDITDNMARTNVSAMSLAEVDETVTATIDETNDSRTQPSTSPLYEALLGDISCVMYKRAINAYGMDIATNIRLTQEDRQLQALWGWLAEVESSSVRSRTSGIGSTVSSGTTSPRAIPTSQLRRKAMMLNGIAAVLSEYTEPQQTQPQTHTQTPTTTPMPNKFFVERSGNSIGSSQTSDSSGFGGHTFFPVYRSQSRQAVQVLCGWYFGMVTNPIEPVLQAMEENEDNEKAAAFSVFHCNIMRALTSLQLKIDRGGDSPELQLAIMGLSGYTYERDSIWREWCSGYCSRIQDPYLRAAFYFLTSLGPPFTNVLNENGMCLSDRLGFACRFLPDKDLHSYIQNTMESYLQEGNLCGISLSGLTSLRGAQLLERYLERTGDIQTVALAVAHVHTGSTSPHSDDPTGGRWSEGTDGNTSASAAAGAKDHITTAHNKYGEWVDSYRDILDRWQLWEARALFDVQRNLVMLTKTAGANQMFVRCNLCNKTVQRSSTLGANSRVLQSRPYNALGSGGIKATVCPSCRKSLPKCSLCLIPVGTPSTADPPPSYPVTTKPLSPNMIHNTSSNSSNTLMSAGAGELLRSSSETTFEHKVNRIATAPSTVSHNTPSPSPPSLSTFKHTSNVGKFASHTAALPVQPSAINVNNVNTFPLVSPRSSIANATSPLSLWFSWCQNCRHGGHAGHITEWFAEHKECPVSACDCQCMLQDCVTMR
eukprot:CFRG1863T1